MPFINLEGADQRKLLSHSSVTTLHKCARKFEIYRLSLGTKERATVHTAFGHAVGAGIQALFLTKGNLQEAYLQAFLAWEVELYDEEEKSKKSFASACTAIARYYHMFLPTLLEDGWELAVFNGKPAIELSFIVELPNGFFYRGFVDLVLVHRGMATFKVLELKTTNSATLNVAQYKNSGQGTGYGVILDKIAGDLGMDSDFMVDYLVYKTKEKDYQLLPFIKTSLQRINWLNQLLMETKILQTMIDEDTFPMHGESCFDFFRPCHYFGRCEMDNATLVKLVVEEANTDFAKDFLVGFNEDGSFEPTTNIPVDIGGEVSYNTTSKEVKPYQPEEFDFIITLPELLANQAKWLDHSTRKGTVDANRISGIDITWE